jgi:hypothetical protein
VEREAIALVEPDRGIRSDRRSRDPIFWATVAIGEQDFDGSGDLSIR